MKFNQTPLSFSLPILALMAACNRSPNTSAPMVAALGDAAQDPPPPSPSPSFSPRAAIDSRVDASFVGKYLFEDVVVKGPGSPQTLQVKISLRRTPTGYSGTLEADGFQTSKTYLLKGEPHDEHVRLILERDESSGGAHLPTGIELASLSRDGRKFLLTLTDGNEPGRLATPTGAKTLRTDRVAPPEIESRGPPAPQSIVEVVPGVSLGPIRIGMTRAELAGVGRVANHPSGQFGSAVVVVGPFSVTFSKEVVSAIELTPSEDDVGVRIAGKIVPANATFYDALPAFGCARSRAVVLGGELGTCPSGVVVKNASRCKARDAAGECLEWETARPVLSVQVTSPRR